MFQFSFNVFSVIHFFWKKAQAIPSADHKIRARIMKAKERPRYIVYVIADNIKYAQAYRNCIHCQILAQCGPVIFLCEYVKPIFQ